MSLPKNKQPIAKNNKSSSFLFEQRKRYEEDAYPVWATELINFWGENALYGQVDQRGDSILPSEKYFKPLSASKEAGKSLFVFNFVADAFRDMLLYFNKASNIDAIKKENTMLSNLKPTSAWSSIHSQHDRTMKLTYKNYVTHFLNENNRRQHVLTFDDFMKGFLEYFDVIYDYTTITKTALMSSGYCPPESSALVINLYKLDHGDDEVKYKKFINDPNFKFYYNAALKHGFLIDKNAPWRLVADIESEAMQKYMSAYDVSLDNLFDKYYYKTHEYDFEIFKFYMQQYYNSFVTEFPYRKQTISQGAEICSKVKMDKREMLTQETIEKKYSDFWWMERYIHVKNGEIGFLWDEYKVKRTTKRAKDLAYGLDIRSAMDYINIECKKSIGRSSTSSTTAY